MDVSKKCTENAKYSTFYESSNSYNTLLVVKKKKNTQNKTNGKVIFLTYFKLRLFCLFVSIQIL